MDTQTANAILKATGSQAAQRFLVTALSSEISKLDADNASSELDDWVNREMSDWLAGLYGMTGGK
jgi:hypothetical protein